MAIDNLNFYSNGLPAGQLTDKYSSQPGCLRSKNLDIFSSSKSVRATAWSNPTTTGSDIIKQDGDLILKTDGKVYELVDGVPTLLVNPSSNFPVYQVSYNGKNGTYANATWGTPQDMVVKYEGDEWKSFVVFTDRNSFTYSKVKFTPNKKIELSNLEYNSGQSGYVNDGYLSFKQSTVSEYASITIFVENPHFSKMPIKIQAIQSVESGTDISIDRISQYKNTGYYYDAELDAMTPASALNIGYMPYSGSLTSGITLDLPTFPTYSDRRAYEIRFKFTKTTGNTFAWAGTIRLWINMVETDLRISPDSTFAPEGDCNYYYSYLPTRERELVPTGEYYRMKGVSFQPLYTWDGEWVEITGEKKIRYDFIEYIGWVSNVSMDVIGIMAWNEAVYMIGNMNGNGYIIPCDLTGGVGTPYIAYGCEFKGVTNIDYLMYLVGEDRGVSQLWVYNGQELVSILGGSEEKNTKNLIDTTEQYKFDGKMVNYRKDLILSTSDNRIFAYGQTYGGKGGVFIHELPGTITKMVSKANDLVVEYEVSSTKYITTLQDDTPIKYYNTEWMAEYPIVLGNHLLEKEESDLYASYILPNSSCKLEFWGMANHYHFRTFKSSDNYTFSTTADYKLKGCTGSYSLKYIEKNGDEYTFRLEGDLPIQTTNDMKITDTEGTELITYTSYNHFRKIGEITTTGYQEGEFRFHNLNNKLELPRSYSLQIMVKGKGTTNYTPELFAVDLVANQRDRG